MSTDRPATTDPADERMRDLADQRAEDFVNNLTGRAEQEHIRKVIAEAVRKAVPMHSGGWVTANNVLDALDREGYTVAPRASEAPRGDESPTPDVGAMRGMEGGSAAKSEPRPVDLAFAALGKWFHNTTPGAEYTYTSHTDDPADCGICWEAAEKATEAAAPLIRAAERELVAAQIEAVFVLARRDQSPAEAKADAYRTAAAIARGES